MEPQQVNGWCWSGQGKYAEAYREPNDVHCFPGCVPCMAEYWELQRENWKDRHYPNLITDGIIYRACHAGSFLIDSIFCVAAPIICCVGTTVAGCYGLKCSYQEQYPCGCYRPGYECSDFSMKLLRDSTVLPALCIGTFVNDLFRLPFNCCAPELMDACAYQQECNLEIHKRSGSVLRQSQ